VTRVEELCGQTGIGPESTREQIVAIAAGVAMDGDHHEPDAVAEQAIRIYESIVKKLGSDG
jgi:hypothetical protein